MTAANCQFVVDLGWQVLLRDLGIAPQDLLRHARLPLDLFGRAAPSLTTDEYFRLWQSLEQLLDDPAFPLRLGQAISVEAFSPPIFACFCSEDLNSALRRLSQYKPLIGPLRLDVTTDERETAVVLEGLPDEEPPPFSLIATELVFLVHLARTATRERIEPARVAAPTELAQISKYEAFFGTGVGLGPKGSIAFRAEDAGKPFLTANESMWRVFEPELRARLSSLKSEDGMRDRVRACLMEQLAGGRFSMSDVADRLAVSTRTLQRRLRDEGTTFQQELSTLREKLARHYLAKSPYSSAEISFLLGYDDPNSFFRAFHAWTGQTPERARAAIRLQ